MSNGRFITTLVTCFAMLPSFSQAAYQFSSYEFARNPARVNNQMRIQMTGRTALRSFRFVGRVGGVNFEGVVDLSAYTIDLDYEEDNQDGSRAIVTIDGQKFTLPLHDWQLKPIVQYADSPYTAAVSIFGEGPDPDRYRYIDYHPAFEDTHLGARLLQADILLMDPITFSEAPTENGEKIYFAGEAQESSEEDRLRSALQIMELTSLEEYQAWVLTDTDLEPTLSNNNGVLEVDMTPYYFFWKSDGSGIDVDIDRYELLAEQAEPYINAYQVAFDKYNDAPVGSEAEKAALFEVQGIEVVLSPLLEELDSLNEKIDLFEPEIIEVSALTDNMRQKYDILHVSAPFVYDAVEVTAQYAAFFRGAKQSNLADWTEFLDEVSGSVSMLPAETPNQFAR